MVWRVTTAEIFGPDLLIVVFVVVVGIGLLVMSILAIVDVSSHSKEDFYEAGSSKVAWIVVISAFTVFYGFGTLIAVYYLTRVRPKVNRVSLQNSNRQPMSASRDTAPGTSFCSQCGAKVRTRGAFCTSCGGALAT
jgi:hypothetical protein